MSTTLLADIGGSKSRFAIANSSGALEHVQVIHNDTAADLDAAVARYLEETGARPRAATLALAGPDEGEVFARLRDECGSVSAETVLSGAGLVRLARALDPRAACHAAETIAASALAREPAAQAAARLFVRLLGRFAGGLALTFKALGGVYIAGGVASGLGPLLDEPQFRAAFEAHPPYQRLLEAIPTLLITCEEPGLIGCAAVASEPANRLGSKRQSRSLRARG